MKENVVVSFLKCFKHVQNMFSTSLDRLCSTIKSPFFVPSSSSSASKHTTNGQLTEIDSHCTTLHTDSTNHNIPWKSSKGNQPLRRKRPSAACVRPCVNLSHDAHSDAPFGNAPIDPKLSKGNEAESPILARDHRTPQRPSSIKMWHDMSRCSQPG